MNAATETNVVVISKAQQAQAIFAEEAAKGDEKLRARVIARFIAELSMGKPGASTYFQNCKTVAAGNKIKRYYAVKGEAVAKTQEVEVEPVFVILPNGERTLMESQQAAELFVKTYGGSIDLGEEEAAA